MPSSTDVVDIRYVDLDDCRDEDFDSLSEDERARAARYATPMLARRFRAGRAALRRLLAERRAVDPAHIAFSANRYGKPQLAWPPTTTTKKCVHFNVSHSGRHALIAFGPSALGIDIESVRTDHAIDGLVELACHPQERQMLDRLPPCHRRVEFYRLWTRKEAYCKAIGSGLQAELTAIRFVRVQDTDGMRVVHGDALQDGCIVRDVAAPTGCMASLCLLAASAQCATVEW